MKILLLGANSYVGSRIYVELSKNYHVIGTFHHNQISSDFVYLDITDKQAVLDLITKEKPDIIIHCANNASRKWCEEHPNEAVVLNQKATEYVVEGANTVKSKVIYISSFAAINPTDLYGKTKYASEEIIKRVNAGYLIIQPAIVIGLSPKTKKEDGFFNSLLGSINEKKPAKHEMTRKSQLTYLGHICEVIKTSIEKNIWGQIIPVAVSEEKTKYDIAKDILSPFGIAVEGFKDPAPKKEPKNLSKLQELNLPTYTYKQVIKKTIEEIRHPEQFVIES